MICDKCKKEFSELHKFSHGFHFFDELSELSFYCDSCYDFMLDLMAELNAPPMSYYDEQW